MRPEIKSPATEFAQARYDAERMGALCNERCEHCYLEHSGENELSTGAIRAFLKQFADAGT